VDSAFAGKIFSLLLTHVERREVELLQTILPFPEKRRETSPKKRVEAPWRSQE